MKDRKTLRERLAGVLKEAPVEKIRRDTMEFLELEDVSSKASEEEGVDMLFEMNERECLRAVTAEYGRSLPFTQQEIDDFINMAVEETGE